MIRKDTVLLLFGGESTEHEVSISSARNIFAALDDSKFNVILAFIDKNGKWFLLDSIDQVSDYKSATQINPVLGESCFERFDNHEKIEVDVILPILHGKNGEDGSVQGLAQLMHIPTVGCGIAASAICIDKALTKKLLEHHGIKTTPYIVHLDDDPELSYNTVSSILGNNVFVKPACFGSSVGIKKAKNIEEFKDAIEYAHSFDNKIIVEKAITAREIEVAILGTSKNAKASRIGEIIIDSEYYDYDSKYNPTSKSKAVIPADIDEKLSNEIRSIALDAYKIIGCSGLSRVDFFIDEDKNVYLNEINTLPGFTNISMYPKLWRDSGVSYSALIEKLILIALESAKLKV